MFIITPEKQNYVNSISACQLLGGDLADVSSEVRTKYLSQLVNTSLNNWYKVAYGGADDLFSRDKFLTPAGTPLRCSTYRAWAPGHPNIMHNQNNCIVLDSERMWRVTNCKRKFPAICELYPQKPPQYINFAKVNCARIKSKCKYTLLLLFLGKISDMNCHKYLLYGIIY